MEHHCRTVLAFGPFWRAIKLISHMRTSVHMDVVVLVIGLNACSHIGALKFGNEIQDHAVQTCFDVFENVTNVLITMYSRCRDLGHAFGATSWVATTVGKTLVPWQ